MFRLLGTIVQNHDSGNYHIKFGQNRVSWYILKNISDAFTAHERSTNNDFSLLAC